MRASPQGRDLQVRPRLLPSRLCLKSVVSSATGFTFFVGRHKRVIAYIVLVVSWAPPMSKFKGDFPNLALCFLLGKSVVLGWSTFTPSGVTSIKLWGGRWGIPESQQSLWDCVIASALGNGFWNGALWEAGSTQKAGKDGHRERWLVIQGQQRFSGSHGKFWNGNGYSEMPQIEARG